VRLAPADQSRGCANRFEGRVREFLYAGDVTTYVLELGSGARFSALRPNDAPGRARAVEADAAAAVEWEADRGLFLES
jgi:spermidine/putrescine transport system ATP-binding protein